MGQLKGILLVAAGACSYGVLATFVKMATNNGGHIGNLTLGQFVWGILILFILRLLFGGKTKKAVAPASIKEKGQLLLAGTAMGLTSTFYYLAIQYIPVSVGIILLMQAIWMGILLEAILERKFPPFIKIMAAAIVLVGTFLATGILGQEESLSLDWRGLAFGLAAASSYTVTLYSSNRVVLRLPNLERSYFMVWGGLIITVLFWNLSLIDNFGWADFASWGLLIAVFGTVLPPILLNEGMPITGTGLGSIIASMEIPVSILFAYLLLNEQVGGLQWLGVGLILAAVFWINWPKKAKA